jgi:hypothetical protein
MMPPALQKERLLPWPECEKVAFDARSLHPSYQVIKIRPTPQGEIFDDEHL